MRSIASKNDRVSSPEQTPSATAAPRSARVRPRRRGRAIGHRISAASTSRSATVPAAPMRSNSGSESAAPSWMIDIDPSTSTMPDAREAVGSGSVDAVCTQAG